jgi:hypothetical protein
MQGISYPYNPLDDAFQGPNVLQKAERCMTILAHHQPMHQFPFVLKIRIC